GPVLERNIATDGHEGVDPIGDDLAPQAEGQAHRRGGRHLAAMLATNSMRRRSLRLESRWSTWERSTRFPFHRFAKRSISSTDDSTLSGVFGKTSRKG